MNKQMNSTEAGLYALVMDTYGLDADRVEDVWFDPDGKFTDIHVTLKKNPRPCPDCQCTDQTIKEWVTYKVIHSIIPRDDVRLIVKRRRWKCKACRRTYTEVNPFVFKKSRISAMTVGKILEELKDPAATFTKVADRYGISSTTVAHMFDKNISYPKPDHLPVILLMDEVYALGRSKKDKSPSFAPNYDSGFVFICLDYFTQKALDVLDNRRQDTLVEYFKGFPLSERQNVKFVAGDMYTIYRNLTKVCFPSAKFCVDRFHVVQDAGRKFTAVRTRIMKKFSTDSDEYYLLKNQNHLLNISPTQIDWKMTRKNKGTKVYVFDPDGERVKNNHFNRWLNRFELREMLLKVDPEIREIYRFKNDLSSFYRDNTMEEAAGALKKLVREMKKAHAPEIQKIAQTLDEWFVPIVNSFSVVREEYVVSSRTGKARKKSFHPSTGLLERKNKDVKTLKRTSCGLVNFERLRNRILYILESSASSPSEELLESVDGEDKTEEEGSKKPEKKSS